MLKKREFVDNAFYHVTSRTNDKIKVFENNLGRKIMLITLQDAKDKFHFRLTNFCIMPTHINLLIQPPLSTITVFTFNGHVKCLIPKFSSVVMRHFLTIYVGMIKL